MTRTRYLSAALISLSVGTVVLQGAAAGTPDRRVAGLAAAGSKQLGARDVDSQRIAQHESRYVSDPTQIAPADELDTASLQPRIWRVRIEPGVGSMFEGSSAAGTRVVVLVNGRSMANTETKSSGRWRVRLPSALTPGDHSITVLAEKQMTGEAFIGQDIRVSIPVGFAGREFSAYEGDASREDDGWSIDDDVRARAEALAEAASRRFAQLVGAKDAERTRDSDRPDTFAFVWPNSLEDVFASTRAWIDQSSNAYRNVVVPNLSYPHPTADIAIPQSVGSDETANKTPKDRSTIFSWLSSVGAPDIEPYVAQVQGWLDNANRAYQDKIVTALTLPEQTSSSARSPAKKTDEIAAKPAWKEPTNQAGSVDLSGPSATRLPSQKTSPDDQAEKDNARREAERRDIARLQADRLAKQMREDDEAAARAAAEQKQLEQDRAAAAKKNADLKAQARAEAKRKAQLEARAKRDADRAAELEADRKKLEADAAKAKEDRLARARAENARKEAEAKAKAEAQEKASAERKRIAKLKADAERKASERERARVDAETRARQAVEVEIAAKERRRKTVESEIIPPTRTKVDVPPLPSRSKTAQSPKNERITRVAKLDTKRSARSKRKVSSRKKFRKKARKSRKKARKTAVRSYKKRFKKKKKWRKAKRCKCGRKSKKKYYRVRRGDSLWKIAKCYYGKGHLYTAIYRANRKRIRNPNRIWVRQRLRLPRLRRRG